MRGDRSPEQRFPRGAETRDPNVPSRPVFGWRLSDRRLHAAAIELEVPFHDVDALRIVWHGHYYKYLELARTRLLRARGLDGADLLALGFGLVMIESGCRYAAPLRYADRVRVTAWFADVEHRLGVGYEITNLSTRRRAAWAHTVLASTDADGRLLLRTPDAILARLLPDATPGLLQDDGVT